MSLRERLGNWIAGNRGQRATTEPFEFEPQASMFFGPGIGNQPTHADLLRESRGVFDAGTRAIANRVASLEPQAVTSRQDGKGTLVDEVVDDHPLQRLFDRPHPDLSWSQLMRLSTQWVVNVGEASWLKVGNGFGVPAELHPIPAGKSWPVIRRGVVQGYVIEDANGRQTLVPPDVVVRFFLPDPENPWGSEGYLGPMGIQADSSRYAGEYLREHYAKNATPATFLEAGENASPVNSDDWKRFLKLWKEYYSQRDGSRRGLPGIGPSGFKLIQLAMQSGAEIAPLLEYWRDDLLLGVGTPRSVLGQVVSGDRSSAETNQYVFDMHTVTPIATLIEDTINLQLAPDFGGEVFMRFAPFVSEDKDYELKREAQDIEHAVRTINAVLEARGEDPVAWGEEPLISGKLKRYDPNAEPEPSDDMPEEDDMDMDSEDMDPDEAERMLHIAARRLARRAKRGARASA